MNSITNLLDLEDTDIEITDIQIQGQTKTLTLSTPPVPHFCPSCGFRMYLSIPIKTSTFFGNSEHSFPEKQSIPFRNRVQFIF